jgi:hypothetical protein
LNYSFHFYRLIEKKIHIKAKYKVSKINLTQDHPLLLIARDFEQSNFILTEPDFIKETKYQGLIINRTDSDLKDFKKYLEVSKVLVQDIGIEYKDENFINLIIKSDDTINRFYTVTKKYYEENVFKYDEFFKFKLIPKCIYQPFQIHRLESYIEKYGDEDGRKRYKEHINKISFQNSLEGYKRKYGDKEGIKIFEKVNSKKDSMSLEYFLQKISFRLTPLFYVFITD